MPTPAQDDEALQRICEEVQVEMDYGGLATEGDIYSDFAKAVARRYAETVGAGVSKAYPINRAELSLLIRLLEPITRAHKAIGDEPGPFRFETARGYRDLSREDLASASLAYEHLKIAQALASDTPPSA